jgi:hypothetical protein
MTLTRNKRKFILDFRMLSILLLIAVVPFLLGTWWFIRSYQGSYLETQGAILAEEADVAFSYLNNYLGNQIIEIAGLTEVPTLRQAIEKSNLDLNRDLEAVRKEIIAIGSRWNSLDFRAPELRAVLDNPASDFLRRYMAVRSSYREIIVTDFLGRTIAATGKTSDYHQANDAWWKEAYSDGQRGGVHISDIHYDDSVKAYCFDVAQPFVGPAGGVIGVIRVGIDARDIHTLIGSLSSGFGGSAALIRTDGSVISAPSYSYLDKRPFPGAPDIISARDNGKHHVIANTEPRAIFGLNSRNFLDMYPHLNWILAISSPVDAVVSPIAHLGRDIIILMLAVALLTFLVALWLSHAESKPVLEEDAHLEQL